MARTAKQKSDNPGKETSPKACLLPEINVGLIGHVDHGKTTLTAALSGKWTDTHSESVKRGITIRLGYADVDIRECPKCGEPEKYSTKASCPSCSSKTKLLRRISLIDAPGHETLIAIMISGAAIMDGALLLVAANEPCPQPQTREHLAALKVLGIKNIIVIQNKVDLVTKEDAKKNYAQISGFVKESLGFEVPIIPVSAQKNANIDLIVQAVQEFMPTPVRKGGENSEMVVARSFDINRPGTEVDKLVGGVLGGAVVSGKFKVGDTLELRPGAKIEAKGSAAWEPIMTRLDSIVCGGSFVKEIGPGGSVAFSTALDPFITKGDKLTGNMVGLKGKLPPVYNNLELETHLFDKVLGVKEDLPIEPIKVSEPLMISVSTCTTLGMVAQIGKKIKLNLRRPVCAHKGDKVAISRQIKNRWHLIGYGVIQ